MPGVPVSVLLRRIVDVCARGPHGAIGTESRRVRRSTELTAERREMTGDSDKIWGERLWRSQRLAPELTKVTS